MLSLHGQTTWPTAMYVHIQATLRMSQCIYYHQLQGSSVHCVWYIMTTCARDHQDSPHTCNTEDGSSSPLQLFYSSPECSAGGSETLLRAESVATHTHACDIALSYNAHHRKPTQLTHLPMSTTHVARHNHFTTGAAFWCIFTVTEENTHLTEGTTHIGV